LVAAAEMQYFFSKNTDQFRVFYRESLYRRRGIIRSGPGPPHHTAAWPRGGHATLGCAFPLGPLRLSFGLCPSPGKNRSFGLHFVQF
jgi:hypothetical protein